VTLDVQQLLQARKDSTTLWQLQDNRTDRIFVCYNDEPHLYQPLRKQEAYSRGPSEVVIVPIDAPIDVDHYPTRVIVVHADGSRTFYADMLWAQVHEQPDNKTERAISVRPRGFIDDWRPRTETRQLLDQVQGVLDEYRDQLPLTLRQIFYRLVGAHAYEKTELAYKQLTEALNRARRARVIEMSAIRDDGFTSNRPLYFESAEDFLDAVAGWAEEFRLGRQKGQKRRLVLWCEASGMVPQFARVAAPFGIEVCSSGGFDGLTDQASHRPALGGFGSDRAAYRRSRSLRGARVQQSGRRC
jgi:hypothetical protein